MLKGDFIIKDGACLCVTAASISRSCFQLTDLADKLLWLGNCDSQVPHLSWCCLMSIQHNELTAEDQICVECLLQLLHDLRLVLHCQFPFDISCATCAHVSVSCNKQNMWCPQLVPCKTWWNTIQVSWKAINVTVPSSSLSSSVCPLRLGVILGSLGVLVTRQASFWRVACLRLIEVDVWLKKRELSVCLKW